MTKEDKNKEIKSKLNKLNKIFKSIPDDRKVVVADLIQNCAFIAVELDDLQELIKEQGSVEHYQNGTQQCLKVSSACQAYNSLAKTYTTNVKVLLGELQEKYNQNQVGLALKKFISK